MESTQTLLKPTAPQPVQEAKINLPDHKQLPDSDGTFVKNFQEHPQSIVLTSSIAPVLEKLHPDGRYCIGQDSGIYWRMMEPPEKEPKHQNGFMCRMYRRFSMANIVVLMYCGKNLSRL
jgi:hypothetical protein